MGSNYDPMESAQIVDSMSDDGKAAYMLRKTANDGMSGYNEVYGYYQMVKALAMSTKGKVKTGTKRTVDKNKKQIPQGFSEKQYKGFVKDLKKVIKEENLPDGELAVHGSRAKGTARLDSDIDIILRVDEKTFEEFTNNRINSAYPGTKLSNDLIKAKNKGKFSIFAISKTFGKNLYSTMNGKYPVDSIDFSLILEKSEFDNGPFIYID